MFSVLSNTQLQSINLFWCFVYIMSSPRINDDVEQTIFITRTNLYNSIFKPQELEANKTKYVCKVHKNNFQLTWTNRLLNKTRKIFGYKSNRKHKNKTKMSNI